MRSSIKFIIALASIVLFSASGASAEAAGYQVDGVVFEGNRRIDADAMRAQLSKTSGLLTDDVIHEGVSALYKTGFFDQVTASVVQPDAKNKRRLLKYSVVEKPLLRKIFIKGNKHVSEDDLGEVLKFEGKRFLDKQRVDTLVRIATSYYQREGFFDAKFDSSVIPVGDSQVDLTLTVDEGKRYKIRRIILRGADDDESDMLTAMQTKRYKWWSSWIMGTGRLNKDLLENDKGVLRNYLLDHGYVDGTVSDAAIEKKEGAIEITIEVKLGEKYKLGKITASGDLIDGDAEKTVSGLKGETGEIFSAAVLREDGLRITDKFADHGYAFANVVPNTSVDRAAKEVNIDYSSAKGKLVSVNEIKISGNEKTYDTVIRRELIIDEQDTYSRAKVRRSQELLERLGYFEEVGISTSPTARDDQVDLNVNVREGSTGTFSAGVGYSTSDGALFNARISENNLFGTGRRASINVDIGTRADNIIFSFTDRRVNDSFWSAGIDAYKTEREYSDFNRALTGSGLTVGYPMERVVGEWARDIDFSTRYEYDQVEISDVDEDNAAQLVIDSEGTSSASAITPRLVRNTVNNPLNPTKGSTQDISYEIAGLGGSQDYTILEAKNLLYVPLWKSGFGDFVFSWRTKFGYGDTPNGEPLPLFKRYFPGGINSVRGYKTRTLGPKDSKGEEYGGSKEFVNNFEMIFPLINSAGLKGVVFYDAGQAWDDDEKVDFGDLRYGYGYGIRWTSPLGPIRVEVGYPVDREPGEKGVVTMFSFGAPLL